MPRALSPRRPLARACARPAAGWTAGAARPGSPNGSRPGPARKRQSVLGAGPDALASAIVSDQDPTEERMTIVSSTPRGIGSLSTGRSQPIHRLVHDLIYVDKAVAFDRDKSWTLPSTGYAGDLQIADFPKSGLISRPYEDRSPIHSPYDYE
jgi:hypothetical protein